jgi:class 3 adenylate cyclase/HAMP domain-containing protein
VRIRAKIILVVLPLIVTPLCVIAIASIFTASAGVTRVETESLRFKAEELQKYAQSQWTILEQNGLSARPQYVDISRAAVASFAASMIRSATELVFATDSAGSLAFATTPVAPRPEETRALAGLASRNAQGWQEVRLGGVDRVGYAVSSGPYGWYMLVTVTRESFNLAGRQILLQSVVILILSSFLAVALLLLLSGYLTRPLAAVVAAMRGIMASNDLSRRVALLSADETGELGHAFNLMTGELESAYNQIKSYALESAIAKKKEERIRNIFQKYVPNDVIERFFQNPEGMLVGENRVLAVLFSDVRDFTRISEHIPADELVAMLNAYFELMVDIITGHGGVVDKYIGDAVMAFFGAPVRHDDDAYQSVLSGFDMLDAVHTFNQEQRSKGHPAFLTGTGIAYGEVTIGNIGSEKKMDYTVVGEMVNLASRLEGLTKQYHEPLIFSDAVRHALGKRIPCRMLDRVAVKGTTKGVDIFTACRQLSRQEEEGWRIHAVGLDLYYKRQFKKAAEAFSEVKRVLTGDETAGTFLDRCRLYISNPPGPDWDGVRIISEK